MHNREVTAGFTEKIRLYRDETFNVWRQPMAVNTEWNGHARDTMAFDNIKL